MKAKGKQRDAHKAQLQREQGGRQGQEAKQSAVGEQVEKPWRMKMVEVGEGTC